MKKKPNAVVARPSERPTVSDETLCVHNDDPTTCDDCGDVAQERRPRKSPAPKPVVAPRRK